MSTQKKKQNLKNHLTVECTKSEMEPEKDTFTDYKRKTVHALERIEEENFKQAIRIKTVTKVADGLEIQRDNLKKEIDNLKIRNEYLEKHNGNKQIKEMHAEYKKDHLTESKKEKILAEEEKFEKALFKSKGIPEYLDDPNITVKKKRKS